MILTGKDILELLGAGVLRIEPFDVQVQLQQNGVDLRLGDQVGVLVDGGDVPRVVTYEHRLTHFRQGYVYLTHTVERVVLPPFVMALVELRSTWARCGLILPPTVVDAGFDGDLTIEVLGAGPRCRIPYGERFVHLIFARCTGDADPYRGKYQGQRGVTPAISDPK